MVFAFSQDKATGGCYGEIRNLSIGLRHHFQKFKQNSAAHIRDQAFYQGSDRPLINVKYFFPSAN